MEYDEGVLYTPHLELHPVIPEDYIRFMSQTIDHSFWNEKGWSNPFHHFEESLGAIPYRAPQVEQYPNLAPLLLRYAIESKTRYLIGSIGFHLPPDPWGMVEIGFTVVEQKRNLGYGKEMLHSMWTWVSDYEGINTFRYSTQPSNLPSQHIIKSLGFKHVGVQMDEIDGEEDIYEMSVSEYLTRFQNRF
jgi:RimJ/RimL family protein N-acetyltransferase